MNSLNNMGNEKLISEVKKHKSKNIFANIKSVQNEKTTI